MRAIDQYRGLYLMLIPGVAYFLVYRYLPMFGLLIAFKDYNPSMGIIGIFTSKWVGFKNFFVLLGSSYIGDIIYNTVSISLLKILFGFPAPIILALLLNELNNRLFKRLVQTITYLPHFISWVIIGGIIFELLSSNGIVNTLIADMGGEKIAFLTNPSLFKPIVIISDVWQNIGWGSIIYLAAISGIDPELYEAATIDGAGKMQQMVSITIPSILSVILIMFILRLGSVLEAGFEQVFMLLNPLVLKTGDIIDTFVYREGLINARFGFATAVGLLKSAIGFVFILAANKLVKKLGHRGIV